MHERAPRGAGPPERARALGPSPAERRAVDTGGAFP